VIWTNEYPLWGLIGMKGTWAAMGWSFLDASLSRSDDPSLLLLITTYYYYHYCSYYYYYYTYMMRAIYIR